MDYILDDMNISGNLEAYLESASFYGNSVLLAIALEFSKTVKLSFMQDTIIRNAIMSDNIDTCKVVLEYLKENFYALKMRDLAISRQNKTIINIFGYTLDGDEAMPKPAILYKVPKTKEISYFDIFDIIIPVLKDSVTSKCLIYVTYEKLLKTLHVPKVHYKEQQCPDECNQEEKCQIIRLVITLVKNILQVISRKHKIFEGTQVIVVGSLKENTKIGKIDETDITLVLTEKYQLFLVFDQVNQKIKLKQNARNVPEELLHCIDESGTFDSSLYFFTFLEAFYEALSDSSLNIPEEFNLQTQFDPCHVCVEKEFLNPQFVRCRHVKGCVEHEKKIQNKNHQENCKCDVYTSPPISYSKVGVVLHLEYTNEDGIKTNLDVDVPPPSVPISNSKDVHGNEILYDGSNTQKRLWLEKNRPINWLPEWYKSEDMSAATRNGEGKKLRRTVRLRFFGPTEVLAEQVGNLSTI